MQRGKVHVHPPLLPCSREWSSLNLDDSNIGSAELSREEMGFKTAGNCEEHALSRSVFHFLLQKNQGRNDVCAISVYDESRLALQSQLSAAPT